MKIILLILFLLSSLLSFSQSGIKEGTYVTDFGDIIIRDDSVITKSVSYYIYHYSSQEDDELNITTYEFFSEHKKHQLTIIYKNELPRHIIFMYRGYLEETFNIYFEPNKK